MTAILAAVFFLNSVGLVYLARDASRQGQSVVERFQEEDGKRSSGEGFATVPLEEGGEWVGGRPAVAGGS